MTCQAGFNLSKINLKIYLLVDGLSKRACNTEHVLWKHAFSLMAGIFLSVWFVIPCKIAISQNITRIARKTDGVRKRK